MKFSLEQDFSLANTRLDRLKQKQQKIKNMTGGILKANTSQNGNSFLPVIETSPPRQAPPPVDQESLGYQRRNTIGVMHVRFNID